jgi:hypothetical protein
VGCTLCWFRRQAGEAAADFAVARDHLA